MSKELEDIEKQIKELNEKKAKIKADEKKKLQKEKDTRYDEVMKAYDAYLELRSAFVKDYGSFSFVKNSNDLKFYNNNFDFPYFW